MKILKQGPSPRISGPQNQSKTSIITTTAPIILIIKNNYKHTNKKW